MSQVYESYLVQSKASSVTDISPLRHERLLPNPRATLTAAVRVSLSAAHESADYNNRSHLIHMRLVPRS
jgi:hypothetical protein